MTKWEYKVVVFRKKGWFSGQLKMEELQNDLNSLGRQGWELINMVKVGDQVFGQGVTLYFKKPV